MKFSIIKNQYAELGEIKKVDIETPEQLMAFVNGAGGEVKLLAEGKDELASSLGPSVVVEDKVKCNDSRDWMELIGKIRGWGRIKDISNPYVQMVKLCEESGELASELCRGKMHNDEVKDALGDIGVVWVILADILGYYAEDCLALAWEQIKDRKGKSVNGGFIKNEESEG